MDNKTGRRINHKKRYKIPLYSYIPSYPPQMGIQTESAKKSICQHSSIQGRERCFQKKDCPYTCG
jgi:hypothetical protein